MDRETGESIEDGTMAWRGEGDWVETIDVADGLPSYDGPAPGIEPVPYDDTPWSTGSGWTDHTTPECIDDQCPPPPCEEDCEPPPAPSCTVTIGFWKNHEDAWPVSSLTINGETYTQQELLDILHTPSRGNASLILGKQLIGALLNGGAGDPAIAATLDDAYAWLADNADADGRLPYGRTSGTSAHDAGTAISGTLDDYNNGRIGPGHCGEGEEPSGTPEIPYKG